jgi:succinyl-CoA synthetase beta subunit
MKLFEHQAKAAFAEAGIPIPQGKLAASPEEALEAAKAIGFPCIIKAQVLSGGRGKAGLIKKANSPEEAAKFAGEILASPAKVQKVLVEQAVNFSQEIYMALTMDPVRSEAMFLVSAEGGVDIEQLAVEQPEKILKVYVDLAQGLMPHHVREITFGLNLTGDTAKAANQSATGLFKVFRATGAELAEINPLFVTAEGGIVAGDGKLIIEASLEAMQAKYPLSPEYFDDPTEYEAALEGIPYLRFDGDIAMMCAGAGLTTSVFDLIHFAGGTVANYLEFGGPNYTKAKQAMELCLKNPCKAILVVTFGTIARADVMAKGVVEAIEALKPTVPIVTCIRGTNEEEAFETLRAAGLEPMVDTELAVQRAVDIAAGRSA